MSEFITAYLKSLGSNIDYKNVALTLNDPTPPTVEWLLKLGWTFFDHNYLHSQNCRIWHNGDLFYFSEPYKSTPITKGQVLQLMGALHD